MCLVCNVHRWSGTSVDTVPAAKAEEVLLSWSEQHCFLPTSLHSTLGSPSNSKSPLAPSVQKLESNLQVLKFYWPYNQQYLWLMTAIVQLSSDSVTSASQTLLPAPTPPFLGNHPPPPPSETSLFAFYFYFLHNLQE